MESTHSLFYSQYPREFYRTKAILTKSLLDSPNHVQKVLSKSNIHEQFGNRHELVLKLDMRFNYLLSIEAFFDLFFALLPPDGKTVMDKFIVKRVSKPNWNEHYDSIERIASGTMDLSERLNSELNYLGSKYTIGEYLFYPSIKQQEKAPENLSVQINESVQAIEQGIIELAKDFSDRQELNAFKHGLRIFPNHTSIHLLDAETMKEAIKFDVSDSVSYNVYNDKTKTIANKNTTLDTNRDFCMTLFTSNLIHNMVFLRDKIHSKNKHKSEKIAIGLFSTDEIYKCSQRNVQIPEFTFKVTEK